MPVCITGMHRSGTSMVAHALSLCGLDLGPEDQLLAADAFNSDGYWENRRFVELDDWLLEQLGGSWDMPPEARATGELRESFVAAAQRTVAEVGFGEPWGWKDPRVCLVADLWRDAIADLRFVVVVRNPVEVVLSLLRRGATSAQLPLSLWSTYYSELLARVPPDDRVLVAYDAFLEDPAGSVERLVERLGIDTGPALREQAAASVSRGLRHHATDPGALAGLPKHVGELYESLLTEARGGAPAELPQAASAPKPSRSAGGGYAVEVIVAAYSERDALRGEVEGLAADRDNWREIANGLESERARLSAAVEAERAEVDELTRDRERWAGELTEDRDRWAAEAEGLAAERDTLAAERDTLAAERETLAAERETLVVERDTLAAERDTLATERETLVVERDRLTAEIEELTRDCDQWAAEAQRLTGEYNRLAAEFEELTRDRDSWQEEAERLQTDREAWQTEAKHWRAETGRLVEAEQQRLRWRVRRAGFRSARRVWWAMPASGRNVLRPVIFRGAGRAQVSAAELPPQPPVAHAAPKRVATRRQELDIPVSIVIPTFNAGDDAALYLAALERQVGVPQLELVVADSGSRDGTRELWTAAADVMIDIPAGEFGHGRTRNQAVAASSGEVVVMMVQDALLLGPHALHDLVYELLADDGLAAVSARQVPRTDADLYGAFNVVSHYRALWREGRRAASSDPLARRAAAGVDDVCAALRRTAWEGVQYRDVEFGEDLDFGMRALDAGWRIGLSDDVAVAHSHTRDAPYTFRRSVADRLNIAPLVGENDVCRSATAAEVAEIVAAGRVLLGDVAATLALTADSPDRLSTLLERIAERVLSPVTTKEPSGGQLGALAEFFAEQANGAEDGAASAPLRSEFAALLRWPLLVEFADAQRGTSPDDAADFAAKLVASVVGRSVGDRLRVHASPEDRERLLVGV